MKEPNIIQILPLDDSGEMFRVLRKYSESVDGNQAKEELIDVCDAQCSLPEFVCDFEGSDKLVAKFYSHRELLDSQASAFDYYVHLPNSPLVENGYSDLYDSINWRFRMTDKDVVEKNTASMDEVSKSDYLEKIESYKTNEAKEKFLIKYVYAMLRFEEKREYVNTFIRRYLSAYTHYHCARIYIETDVTK